MIPANWIGSIFVISFILNLILGFYFILFKPIKKRWCIAIGIYFIWKGLSIFTLANLKFSPTDEIRDYMNVLFWDFSYSRPIFLLYVALAIPPQRFDFVKYKYFNMIYLLIAGIFLLYLLATPIPNHIVLIIYSILSLITLSIFFIKYLYPKDETEGFHNELLLTIFLFPILLILNPFGPYNMLQSDYELFERIFKMFDWIWPIILTVLFFTTVLRRRWIKFKKQWNCFPLIFLIIGLLLNLWWLKETEIGWNPYEFSFTFLSTILFILCIIRYKLFTEAEDNENEFYQIISYIIPTIIIGLLFHYIEKLISTYIPFPEIPTLIISLIIIWVLKLVLERLFTYFKIYLNTKRES